MMTPLGWLERVPTYKDQQEKLSEKDLTTYGFLGYPLLQSRGHPDLSRQPRAGGRRPGAAHRIHARNRAPLQPHLRPRTGLRGRRPEAAVQEAGLANVPSCTPNCATRYQEQGDDEALESGQGAARRAAEPEPGRPGAPVRLPRRRRQDDPGRARGLADRSFAHARAGRAEDVQVLQQHHHPARRRQAVNKKIRTMPTDPARVRRTDPGDPEKCPVWRCTWCIPTKKPANGCSKAARRAGIGCLECKQPVIDGGAARTGADARTCPHVPGRPDPGAATLSPTAAKRRARWPARRCATCAKRWA